MRTSKRISGSRTKAYHAARRQGAARERATRERTGVKGSKALTPLRPRRHRYLRIMQYNAGGGLGCQREAPKVAELRAFTFRHQPDIFCIQESHLSDNVDSPRFPGYALIRVDRGRPKGGVLVLVRDGLTWAEIKVPPEAKVLGAEIAAIDIYPARYRPCRVINMYLPPEKTTGFQWCWTSWSRRTT